MDIDLQLIKLVRQRPIIYKNSGEVNAKRIAWKEISSLIGKDESWTQIRWHTIIQNFKKELRIYDSTKCKSKYKYFDALFFLIKHIDWKVNNEKRNNKQPDVDIESIEFIITDAQLEEIDESSDSDGNIFEELEEENIVEEAEQTIEETEQTIEETQKNDSCQNEEMGYEEDYKTMQIYEIENNLTGDTSNEMFIEDGLQKNNNAKYEDDNKELPDKENQIKYDEIVNNQDLISIDIRKNDIAENYKDLESNSEILNVDQAEKTLENGKKTKLDRTEPRCEDTIFAELVGVMLKKMDSNKKKNAKREIMNILLT